MAKTFDLKRFTNGLSSLLLQQYCSKNGLKFQYNGGDKPLDESFETYYLSLERKEQQIIDIDFSDVNDLTPGIATDLLLDYYNQYNITLPDDFINYSQNDKALWFFLNGRPVFDRVYQEYEFQDMSGWKYVKTQSKKIVNPQEKAEKLGKALSEYLFSGHMKGRICYVRSYIQDNIQYFTAFPEGYTVAEMEYNTKEKLTRFMTKPVDRIYFSYEPETGRIGVRSKGKTQTKRDYQGIFNNIVIENFDVLSDDRIFNLDKLKDSTFLFEAPSEYRVKYVKVKSIMIKLVEENWRITIDVYNEAKTGLSEILEALKKRNLVPDEFTVLQAIIKVQFEKTGTYKSRDSVTFRLNWPNSYNLTNKKRDLVVKQLLKIWQLDIEK